MNNEVKKRLLEIARTSAFAAAGGESPPAFSESDPALNEKCGAFVTIKNHGRLRGCLGNFTSDEPLYKLVANMAAASVTQDPRFTSDPITLSEMDDIDIEISILSPLQKVDDPLDFELGKDGVYIKRGAASGCFLPQVAVETGWSKEEFLSLCCEGKAGLPPDAWRDPETEVYIFAAEIISEKDFS